MILWWREKDSNLRASGHAPDELPGCSTPRYFRLPFARSADTTKAVLRVWDYSSHYDELHFSSTGV